MQSAYGNKLLEVTHKLSTNSSLFLSTNGQCQFHLLPKHDLISWTLSYAIKSTCFRRFIATCGCIQVLWWIRLQSNMHSQNIQDSSSSVSSVPKLLDGTAVEWIKQKPSDTWCTTYHCRITFYHTCMAAQIQEVLDWWSVWLTTSILASLYCSITAEAWVYDSIVWL